MAEKRLTTPFSEKEIRSLGVGDTVYVTGKIFTARDEAHHKMLELASEGGKIPFNPDEMALFHCGPVVKKEDGKWQVISAGPTTSIRMEIFTDQFLSRFGPRMIIGKGGMGEKTLAALKDRGAVYAHYTGGAGALAAKKIESVEDVYWLEELGIPEAVWIFKVQDFGPLSITMDSGGESLYASLNKKVKENLKEIQKRIQT